MSYRQILIILTLLFLCALPIEAQNGIRIWEGTNVDASDVTLTEYPPKGENKHIAVIICPGGSYCWRDMKSEGKDVAQWLSKNGITAFVIRYRVQGIFPFITHSRLIIKGNQHPDMISDLQRAIQYVRDNAQTYNIDTDRIGVIGFSAGGHLAMSAGEMFSTNYLGLLGIEPTSSLRPDFVGLLYPVVTFTEKCTHGRSRRALLGELGQYNRTLRDSLSLEKHVAADCPPVFLVNCKDDPTVDYHNSELLDSALTAHGVRHKYIQYQTGGHGFGASSRKGTEECRQWKDEFLKWLDELFTVVR